MMRTLSDLPHDFLKRGYCIQKLASGASMLPSIPDGTVLQIEPLQQDCVRLGDVVYFLDNNENTKIHRVSFIVRKGNNTFIQTWGDNCENPDAVVRGSQILGRVIAYRGEDQWHRMDSRTIVYTKYFFKRYGWYYIKKIPATLLKVCRR